MKMIERGSPIRGFLIFLLVWFLATPAWAADEAQSDFWGEWWGHVKKAAVSTDFELHVPVNIWHNRLTYDHDRIKRYNERPWGIGFGNYLIDEHRNQHSFTAMAFKDSHNDWEPVIGYSWQKNWYFGGDERKVVGLGYLVGITMRSDYDYAPLPALLPILSLEYWKFSITSTYIPSLGKNNGNVLFTWLKWKF